MTSKQRFRLILAVLMLGFVGAFASGRAWYWLLCLPLPMTFAEVDRNRDGVVSFIEASYVSSSGTREVQQDGRRCVEYYALKDGLPLKVVCPP